jgi:hypothetical protein
LLCFLLALAHWPISVLAEQAKIALLKLEHQLLADALRDADRR